MSENNNTDNLQTVDNEGVGTDIDPTTYSLDVEYTLVLTATQVNAQP